MDDDIPSSSDADWESVLEIAFWRYFRIGVVTRVNETSGELICEDYPGVVFSFGAEDVDLGFRYELYSSRWFTFLKEGDQAYFTPGRRLESLTDANGQSEISLAHRIVLPETSNDDEEFLCVVIRSRHLLSMNDSTVTSFCPPFGIIPVHKFSLGRDVNMESKWPFDAGTRIWVAVDRDCSTQQFYVSRVLRFSDDDRFECHTSGSRFFPHLVYRWQRELIIRECKARNHPLWEHLMTMAIIDDDYWPPVGSAGNEECLFKNKEKRAEEGSSGNARERAFLEQNELKTNKEEEDELHGVEGSCKEQKYGRNVYESQAGKESGAAESTSVCKEIADRSDSLTSAFLAELLNDKEIQRLVILRHKDSFQKYFDAVLDEPFEN